MLMGSPKWSDTARSINSSPGVPGRAMALQGEDLGVNKDGGGSKSGQQAQAEAGGCEDAGLHTSQGPAARKQCCRGQTE